MLFLFLRLCFAFFYFHRVGTVRNCGSLRSQHDCVAYPNPSLSAKKSTTLANALLVLIFLLEKRDSSKLWFTSFTALSLPESLSLRQKIRQEVLVEFFICVVDTTSFRAVREHRLIVKSTSLPYTTQNYVALRANGVPMQLCYALHKRSYASVNKWIHPFGWLWWVVTVQKCDYAML